MEWYKERGQLESRGGQWRWMGLTLEVFPLDTGVRVTYLGHMNEVLMFHLIVGVSTQSKLFSQT